MRRFNRWEIIRNGRVIDTVYWARSAGAEEVRRSLVNHDGYPSDITVRLAP